MKRYVFSVLVIAVLTCLAGAQQASAPSNSVGQTSTTQGAAVPTLVRYYGVAKDLNGNPLTDVVGATFALYTEETGGAALWIETQNVYPDATGHYSVQLGATRAEGLPLDLFVSGEARWLGIQISGQAEQPRVLLLSVPYALKAGDAATIGGLPPSAFMLANPANTPSSATQLKNPFTSKSASTPGSSTVTTSGGTVDAIPLFSTSTDIENSILSQRVTSNSSVINVNGSRSAPGWLQVQGEVQIGTHSSNNVNWGVIELESKPALQACCNFGNFFVGGAGNFNQINGTKNIGLGYDALINLNGISATQNTALGYSSLYATTTGSSNTAVGAYSGVAGIGITTGSQNTFVGYSASSGSATLNNATAVGSNAFVSESNALVLGSIAGLNGATNNTNVGIGTSVPAYTLDVEAPSGFNPTVNFGNSTQTANFTMNGTANITGSLYVNGQQVTGGGGNGGSGTVTSVGLTAPSTDFLVTGSPITASGTLGLAWLVPPTSTDTPNAIVKRDTSGNISAATVNADTQFNLGGTMFDSGSSASNDAFLGFAGNGTNPGVGNVAAGWQALSADTSGGSNVAAGYKALNNDTTGSFNVAVGNFAGQSGDGSPMTGN
ncbi:MAG TPA: hypothetical protein VGS78_03860, partial [Candidatus Sulfotelmatobacter sp.]|nr:hypothetical protein [Candidatus Sulfotelmatobacter sp.]